MAKRKVVSIPIDEDRCKGCGICVHFCPKQVLKLSKHEKCTVVNQDACIGCRLCEIRCPDLAIEVIFDNEK